MPGTGGASTASTVEVPVPSMGTAQVVGPLTSSPSSRGQSSGGVLWRAGYTPGDRLTSWVYSTTFVQYLHISCYTVAKTIGNRSDRRKITLFITDISATYNCILR
jgi:hypothetical protein